MNKLFSISFLAILLVSNTHAETKIYEWEDENGQTHYSDVQPTHKDEVAVQWEEDIKARMSQNPQEEQAKEKAVEAEETTPLTSQRLEFETDESIRAREKAMRHNCKVARSNLTSLKKGGRIKTTDSSGKSRMLSRSEVKSLIRKYEKLAKESC